MTILNNNRIFSFFSLISSISFAGDFESKETAKTIAKLYQEQIFKESTSRFKTNIKIDGCNLISVNEYDDSFFRIDMDGFEKYPKETQALYEFLKNNGFIIKIGKIYPFKILKNKFPISAHLPLKKELINEYGGRTISAADSINFIMTTDENKSIFHETHTGIFLRNRNNNSKTISEDLLVDSTKAQELLNDLKSINSAITIRISTLKDLISRSTNIQDFLRKCAQLPEQLLPEITIKQLRENINQPLRNLKKFIDENEEIHNQRKDSIKFINPTPLDIMLLYSFYHFEESKLLGQTGSQLDFLNSFNELDDLSVANLLRPFAYEVLEKLSFKKPKKKKKKAKKKKTTSTKIVEASEDEEEPVTQSSENSRVDNSQILHEPASSLEKSLDEQKTPPKNQNFSSFVLHKDHRMLDTLARLLSRELCLSGEPTGSVSIALINDKGQDKLAVALKHTRRDVAPVLTGLKNVVTYSNILARKVKDNFNDFMKEKVSTIAEVDQNLLNKDHRDIKKSSHNRIEARQDIDKIKFHLYLASADTTPLKKRIKAILSKIDESNIILVDNALNYHSEIALADYLIEHGLELGFLAEKATAKKFQYIGNSIKMCSKCTGILRGVKNVLGFSESMIFHFRGSFNIGYPNYMIPARALKINHCDRFQLSTKLDQLGSPAKSVSNGELMLLQSHDVSDSEEG